MIMLALSCTLPLLLGIYTRNYTVPLKIYFSYFPFGKKLDVLMLYLRFVLCCCCVCCVLWIAADGSHGW